MVPRRGREVSGGRPGHRLSALFAVGVAVGLRRGELLALAWDDVDLDAGILRVRRTVQRFRGQGLVFGPGKSSRSRRSIPLPESSRVALLSHRDRQELERLAVGESWQASGLVFTTSVGTVVEPRNPSRTFEQLVQRSGVRRVRFHDLRHTCASLLLAQGVSPRVVMDVLGHSQLSITMDLYSHVMPSALRYAADAMDRALSQIDDPGSRHASGHTLCRPGRLTGQDTGEGGVPVAWPGVSRAVDRCWSDC